MNAIVWQVSRFSVVGGAATLIHILIAQALVYYHSIDALISNVIAFLFSFIISFSGHYCWSFSAKNSRWQAIYRFFLVSLIAMAVSNLILIYLIESDLMRVEVSIFLAAMVVPVFSFFLSRLWAFKWQ